MPAQPLVYAKIAVSRHARARDLAPVNIAYTSPPGNNLQPPVHAKIAVLRVSDLSPHRELKENPQG